MLAPKTKGRRVPIVVLDWDTNKVLSDLTSTIEGMAGWHFPVRNDLKSLTRWASLLCPSSSSLRNRSSMSAWASRGTSYIIQAAFLWMTSSFFRWVLADEEKIEEQYSMCDLIRAVYNNFSRSLGRYGVALANIPRSPWHLLTTLSIWGPKVRCWSKVTPSNFTVFSGKGKGREGRKRRTGWEGGKGEGRRYSHFFYQSDANALRYHKTSRNMMFHLSVAQMTIFAQIKCWWSCWSCKWKAQFAFRNKLVVRRTARIVIENKTSATQHGNSQITTSTYPLIITVTWMLPRQSHFTDRSTDQRLFAVRK